MNRSVTGVFGTAVVAGVLVGTCLGGAAPTALAEPDSVSADVGGVTEYQVPPEALMAAAQEDDPTTTACKQFNGALNLAASNYEDFAYATAGSGNFVDYQDPNVWRTNVIGRTGLREAAAVALNASRTPGLQGEIAGPMRAWSLRAAKLLVVMGLHAGGDTLNNSASDLNTDASEAQTACALAGAHA